MSAFSSSGSDYSSTISSSHSFSEAVLIFSFSSGRLKCSFHDRISLSSCCLFALSEFSSKRTAKIDAIFLNTNQLSTFVWPSSGNHDKLPNFLFKPSQSVCWDKANLHCIRKKAHFASTPCMESRSLSTRKLCSKYPGIQSNGFGWKIPPFSKKLQGPMGDISK